MRVASLARAQVLPEESLPTTSSIAQFAVFAMDSFFYALDSVSIPSLAFPGDTFSAYLIVPQYAPEGVCVFVC